MLQFRSRAVAVRVVAVMLATALIAACDRSLTSPSSASRASRPGTLLRDVGDTTCRSGFVLVDGRMTCSGT
jgi:tRNA A37 threonylcarbamoyladenosine synthetase subunit TsaC/SUA5/YrdC